MHLPAVLHRGSACFWNNGVVEVEICFDGLCYVVSMQKNVGRERGFHSGSGKDVRRSTCGRQVDVANANHRTRLRSPDLLPENPLHQKISEVLRLSADITVRIHGISRYSSEYP